MSTSTGDRWSPTSAAAFSASMANCLSFMFLIIATTSPWTLFNWFTAGYPNGFGIGPFYAGMQAASVSFGGDVFLSRPVLWSDLNSANVCDPALGFQKWTTPNGLCNSANQFVLPSAIQGIQACVILATIFAMFACVGAAQVNHESKRRQAAASALFSCLAMVFTIATFSIWAGWSTTQRYLSWSNTALEGGIQRGDFIPLWIRMNGSSSARIGLSLTSVPLVYGWTYVTSIISFLLLLYSTLVLVMITKRVNGNDDGKGNYRSV